MPISTPVAASLPADFVVERGQTQRDVNRTVLNGLVKRFASNTPLRALDLPCGNLEFLTYMAKLFPAAELHGADIMPPRDNQAAAIFTQMDLTKEFILPAQQQCDLVTSISGVMMFGNTLSFIQNCVARLKPGGTFVVTNDNAATILDKLAYLFWGGHRIFKPVFEDTEAMTQIIPIQEIVRLLRTHGIAIEQIEYTSFYWKDILFLPFALLVYPIQKLYMRRLKTQLPPALVAQLYPLKHLFCKHYIITGRKID